MAKNEIEKAGEIEKKMGFAFYASPDERSNQKVILAKKLLYNAGTYEY